MPRPLAAMLEACWPLHPLVACLLGPISRRRFGQNQRSIFGFLNSSEPHGFQDFLNHTGHDELYGPDRLWDYLRANLEPSILASPDGHRWALAAEALERCESIGGEALHINLLKTIAVIDLFKERSGLVANSELLRACFPKISARALERTLAKLDTWSFTIFKKFLDARAIFAGSDFDIDQAVRAALDEIDEIDFRELKSLAGLQPILAKRHYHETGALRWFDVNIVPVSRLVEFAAHLEPDNGAIGQFLLAIPTEGESDEHAEDSCRKAAHYSDDRDIVVGISKRSWAVVRLVRELFALDNISNDYPELAGDPVARREVSARLAALQALLETELHKAFDSALWFRKNHQPKRLRQADLNSVASELADRRFDQSPSLHNELLNRQKPSSNAIAAQNNLLRRMVLKQGESRLGIEGFPAEGGLFASALEATGLYVQEGKGGRFVSPMKSGADPRRLAPIWDAAFEYLKKHANRTVPVSELFELWRKPPFGVKDGLMPILAVAFMLSQRDKLAVYRDGIFRAKFDDVDVDYLGKDAAFIQLRWMDLTDIARRLLSGMAQVVRDLDKANELVHLEPIDVGRGLVAIYGQLPQWTTRTMRLSSNAVNIRDLFKRAHDPNQFLFDDIPGTLGEDLSLANVEELRRVIGSVRDGLEELVLAYPSMLHRLRDLMLAELQVPNVSPQSLAELRDRAENIRQLAGDFRLDAFVGRLSQFDGSDESVEGNRQPCRKQAAARLGRSRSRPCGDRACRHGTEIPPRRDLCTRQGASRQAAGDGRRHRHKRSPCAAAGGIRYRRFRPRDRQRSYRASDHHAGTIRHQAPQHHSGGAGGTQHALHAEGAACPKEWERKSRFLTTGTVKHVLGLSGGRDSAALAVYMRQHHPEMEIEYFFTDTGKELPEVYEYLGRLEGFLGQSILRLNPDRDFDFWLRQYNDFFRRRKRAGARGS